MVGVTGDAVGSEGEHDVGADGVDRPQHRGHALLVGHLRAAAVGMSEDRQQLGADLLEGALQFLLAEGGHRPRRTRSSSGTPASP